MSMTIAQTDELKQRPLRLWPGVVAAVLLLLVRFILPIVASGTMMFGVLGGLVGGLAIVVWWLFFSRAPWAERVSGIVLMIVALFATSRLVHKSIANGMMGMMLPIYAIFARGDPGGGQAVVANVKARQPKLSDAVSFMPTLFRIWPSGAKR